jgi:hypothetical protein
MPNFTNVPDEFLEDIVEHATELGAYLRGMSESAVGPHHLESVLAVRDEAKRVLNERSAWINRDYVRVMPVISGDDMPTEEFVPVSGADLEA